MQILENQHLKKISIKQLSEPNNFTNFAHKIVVIPNRTPTLPL